MVQDTTKSILSCDSNHIVKVAMWPKFDNSSITMREVIITLILQRFDLKKWIFEGCFWFKFNYLGLALGMAFKFYTAVTKELRVRKFRGLIPTFGQVTWEKLVGVFLAPSPPLILKRVQVKQAQVARDKQFLFQNVQNNEIFEIFKMVKSNRWVNVYYTKSKHL